MMQSDSRNEPCARPRKNDHSQTVGRRGPVLAQDGVLHETLEEFVHEKIIERAVHTKGYGAFGSFKTIKSMSAYTDACFLQAAGQKTATFSRFSLAVSKMGTPDTSRNVRGFSTKFYTKQGNFDLLTNHIPVFLVRDGIKFPRAIKALSPSPTNNLMNPASFWAFVAENPEATHFLTWLYSDIGTVKSLRTIRTYGVNTYVWKNAAGERRFVKYHWIPLAGQKSIDRKEAEQLAGSNPDIAGRELFDTLAKGKKVEYELHVQLMTAQQSQCQPFDILDDTKVWSETEFPLQLVGRLTLNKNPDNFQQQVEKAAFSPSNLVSGIELSNDKLLQGRSTIYWDAQRRRIGPEFREVPVNYEKNWTPESVVTSGDGEYTAGKLQRSEIKNEENFAQAGEHYRSLTALQRSHLVDNIASELYAVPESISRCVVGYLTEADPELGKFVQRGMNWYKERNQYR